VPIKDIITSQLTDQYSQIASTCFSVGLFLRHVCYIYTITVPSVVTFVIAHSLNVNGMDISDIPTAGLFDPMFYSLGVNSANCPHFGPYKQ